MREIQVCAPPTPPPTPPYYLELFLAQGGGVLNKCLYKSNPLVIPLYIPFFSEKGTSDDKWYPFHILCLELRISYNWGISSKVVVGPSLLRRSLARSRAVRFARPNRRAWPLRIGHHREYPRGFSTVLRFNFPAIFVNCRLLSFCHLLFLTELCYAGFVQIVSSIYYTLNSRLQ